MRDWDWLLVVLGELLFCLALGWVMGARYMHRRFVPPGGRTGADGAPPIARTTTRPNAPGEEEEKRLMQRKAWALWGSKVEDLKAAGWWWDGNNWQMPRWNSDGDLITPSWDEGLDSDSDSGSR